MLSMWKHEFTQYTSMLGQLVSSSIYLCMGLVYGRMPIFIILTLTYLEWSLSRDDYVMIHKGGNYQDVQYSTCRHMILGIPWSNYVTCCFYSLEFLYTDSPGLLQASFSLKMMVWTYRKCAFLLVFPCLFILCLTHSAIQSAEESSTQ